jgi:hypothetical protein
MTIEEAKAAVEEIRWQAIRDDERAHSLEDELHVAVLKEIVEIYESNEDSPLFRASELAKIALSTREIKFARWCA